MSLKRVNANEMIIWLYSPIKHYCHLRFKTFNAYPLHQFKVDRLQIILVAKKDISTCRNSRMFISRMPKMHAIPKLVSASLNPIPIAEHFRRSHPPCEHSHGQHI